MGVTETKIVNSQSLARKINQEVKCPYCNTILPPSTTFEELNHHISQCKEKERPVDTENDDFELVLQINTNTNFDCKETNKNLQFEEKQIELWNHILKEKLYKEQEFHKILIEQNSSSKQKLAKFENLDLYENIQFCNSKKEKLSTNVLMNQNMNAKFLNNFIEELTSEKNSAFINENGLIKINCNVPLSNIVSKKLKLLGKVIAKSIIDNIHLNIFFNRMIYKQIVEEEITFNDLFEIEKNLYESLNLLKSCNSISSLNIYFAVLCKDAQGKQVCFDLVKNGRKVLVTNDNVDFYIDKRIEFLVNTYSCYINEIKQGIFEIIPRELITQFNSYELEMIVCGRNFLNVCELEQVTQYLGHYDAEHSFIKTFWTTLGKQNQIFLRKFFSKVFGLQQVNGGVSELLAERKFMITSTFSSYHSSPNLSERDRNNVNSKNIYIKKGKTAIIFGLPLFKTTRELNNALLAFCN